MSRRSTVLRYLAVLLLPLLAAALACSLPSTAPPTPNALTQAAAITIAATDAVAPLVDPCSFMTTAEASALAGSPGTPPKPLTGGGCIYYDTTITTTGVGLYVLPAAHAQAFMGQYAPAFIGNGIPVDQKVAIKLSDDIDADDMPAAVNDLANLTSVLPGYDVRKLAGVGSAALWSWHTLDQNQEGVLMAANPGALVVMILHGTATTQETDAQPLMVTIVTRILSRLPSIFIVPGLH